MKYIRAGDIKPGDYIINLGRVEKTEKALLHSKLVVETAMEYIRAGNLKIGDYILNLGKVESAEKFQHSIDNEECINIKITHGICFSAAFFWYKCSQMIAIQNEQ